MPQRAFCTQPIHMANCFTSGLEWVILKWLLARVH